MKELVRGRDQLPGRLDIVRVVRVLPPDQVFDELQASVPGRIGDGRAVAVLRRELVLGSASPSPACGNSSGTRDRRGRGSARRTPPPGRPPAAGAPPDVQRRNMPMPDRLLPGRLLGDFLEGQGNFNKAFQHGWLVLLGILTPLGVAISDNNWFRKCFPAHMLRHFCTLLSSWVRQSPNPGRGIRLGISPDPGSSTRIYHHQQPPVHPFSNQLRDGQDVFRAHQPANFGISN